MNAARSAQTTILEARVEIDIQTPFLIAMGHIDGNWKSQLRQDEQTKSITSMKTVPSEIAGPVRHLSAIEKEAPVQGAPDAVSIFDG